MASSGLGKELECSVCLNLYTDPVTLRCGHSFCRLCIDQVLNTQEESEVYSCPECRAEFKDRPTLQRNVALCNVVKNFLPTHQDDDVLFCSYCVDIPLPAVISCLHCEAHLCNKHLRVHSKAAEHVLTDPTTSLESRKCPIHKKILEYYCTEDANCICVSCCLIGDHQGHKVKSLEKASHEKKEKLINILQKLTTKMEVTEERIQSLEERRRNAQEKAAREEERVNALCGDIRRWLDDLEEKVLSRISWKKDHVLLSLSNLIQKVAIKKDELLRKKSHIVELYNMTDPLTVLQEPATDDLCDPEEEGGYEDQGKLDGGNEDTEGHDINDRGEERLLHISRTFSGMIRDINVSFYIQDPSDLSLDVNTADNNLLISDDLKTATWTEVKLNRPERAERFNNFHVLSRSRFSSGRHYWDVEIGDSEDWTVGMCYSSMDRRGCQSYSGDNNKSWCLHGYQYNYRCLVIHDKKVTQLPHLIVSTRFRIYLDYEAGQLSFYELSDPIGHLHTFRANFTEPLHAALYVWKGCIKIHRGSEEAESHHRY